MQICDVLVVVVWEIFDNLPTHSTHEKLKIVKVEAALYFPALFSRLSLAVCIFAKKYFWEFFSFFLLLSEDIFWKLEDFYLPLSEFTSFSCLEKKILEVAAARTEKAKLQRCMNQS